MGLTVTGPGDVVSPQPVRSILRYPKEAQGSHLRYRELLPSFSFVAELGFEMGLCYRDSSMCRIFARGSVRNIGVFADFNADSYFQS